LYRKPRTSTPGVGAAHRLYPYLLSGLAIERPNQVWGADITYIPMTNGFLYLVLGNSPGAELSHFEYAVLVET
jgi:putative transposase